MEKMWPFETDQRIPFFIRGPGIDPGWVAEWLDVLVECCVVLHVGSSPDGLLLLCKLRLWESFHLFCGT